MPVLLANVQQRLILAPICALGVASALETRVGAWMALKVQIAQKQLLVPTSAPNMVNVWTAHAFVMRIGREQTVQSSWIHVQIIALDMATVLGKSAPAFQVTMDQIVACLRTHAVQLIAQDMEYVCMATVVAMLALVAMIAV
jgi:hypothetical protein